MLDLYFKIKDELKPKLRSGDLGGCQRRLNEVMNALPKSPFHMAIELEITNSPESVASFLDYFFRRESASFKIGAAYCEMNGFSINPDRWFFNAFAYIEYSGDVNFDWLAYWQSEDYDDLTINGLESLQHVYGSDAFRQNEYSDACSIADLLVAVKFHDLIRRASIHMRRLKFPLLAAVHGSDFIFEVRKG